MVVKDPVGFTQEATDIVTEGRAIPCLKLVHRGEKRRDVIKLLERNNRFPSFAGDLAAMISAVQHCVKLLEDVVRKWGGDVVKAAVNYNIEHTEKSFREEIAKRPDGSYEADEIGRASCRERVCPVRVDLGGRRVNKKKKNTQKPI